MCIALSGSIEWQVQRCSVAGDLTASMTAAHTCGEKGPLRAGVQQLEPAHVLCHMLEGALGHQQLGIAVHIVPVESGIR